MVKVKSLKNTLIQPEKNQSNVDHSEEYNEQEQARLFKEAVEEFRKNKPIESGTIPDTPFLPINKRKDCCWTCVKVVLAEEAIEKVFEDKLMKLKVVILLMTILDFLFRYLLRFIQN